MQEQRTPVIDLQTWEVLMDVYKIIAAADNSTNHQIERNDLSYMHAKLEDVLKFNSLPKADPRSDTAPLARLKRIGRQMLP